MTCNKCEARVAAFIGDENTQKIRYIFTPLLVWDIYTCESKVYPLKTNNNT